MTRQQTCLVQPPAGQTTPVLSRSQPMPTITDSHQVLLKVLAVALNPTDYKMPQLRPTPGATIGCDFVGVVEMAGSAVKNVTVGTTRLCGVVHGSNPANPEIGAFAEYVVQDARLCLRVPENWSDLEAAALGASGWATTGLTMESALGLTGCPSKPAPPRPDGTRTPVLVYGGATATGTMACQLLKRSGYDPIATASLTSAPLVKKYGAALVVPYASAKCSDTIKAFTKGQLRHAIDCITSPDSLSCCFAALGRVGCRYASLEYAPDTWKTRKAVKCDMIMTYVVMGREVELPEPYHRDADLGKFDLGVRWAAEVQTLLDQGRIKCHPPKEIDGKWAGIVKGLEMLKDGQVRGQKLVVRISENKV